MIVVTGASGKLGRAIVDRLLERVEPAQLCVSVRDSSKVKDLAERGVRVRQADFDDANSLRLAFEGASQVLLVSSNAGAFGGDPVAQHRNAISAARAAGARRILYTSHQAASPSSAFGPARHHAATEALLEAAGVPFTSLRNGFYSTTVPLLLGDATKTGEWRVPAGGKASWTAPPDLAEAAAIILTSQPGRFDGPITLTASEAPDLAEVAEIASKQSGRKIQLTTISDEEYRTSLLARGTPIGIAELTLSIFVAMRQGEFALVDPTLQTVLARKPRALD
jgi:uncharacterized protein YbjT (DUF2867 family)